MAPIETPVVGDMLGFREEAPRVYDNFPTGAPVPPTVAFVDFSRSIRVEEVREQWVNSGGMCVNGYHRRDRDELYVAVMFTSDNGTVLWTLFSKGEDRQLMDILVVV